MFHLLTAPCRQCGPPPIRRTGLLACYLCPPGEASLCCAKRHATICSLCAKLACVREHLVKLFDGGVACSNSRPAVCGLRPVVRQEGHAQMPSVPETSLPGPCGSIAIPPRVLLPDAR